MPWLCCSRREYKGAKSDLPFAGLEWPRPGNAVKGMATLEKETETEGVVRLGNVAHGSEKSIRNRQHRQNLAGCFAPWSDPGSVVFLAVFGNLKVHLMRVGHDALIGLWLFRQLPLS